MRYILTLNFLSSLLLLSSIAHAQKHSVHFYTNTALDYHYTQHVENLNIPQGLGISASKTIGVSLGGVFVLQHKNGMYMQAGIDLRYSPNRININYNAAQLGYTGYQHSEQQDFNYNKVDLAFSIRPGYSFILPDKKSSIDFAGGVIFNFPVNGATNNGNEVVYRNITDNEYKDLIMYQRLSWGNNAIDNNNYLGYIPLHLQYSLQLFYRLHDKGLVKGKGMRVGIDINNQLLQRSESTLEVHYFDKDRNEIGSSTYNDYFSAISLVLGFGI